MTAWRLNVDIVSGVMNSFADGVMITWTSAPAFTKSLTSDAVLYAAIPPHTPTTMFFPLMAPIPIRFYLRSILIRLYIELNTALVLTGKSPSIIQV